MKKLMVIVAAVAMAAVAQAASFSWQVATGSTYASMNVYCIQGTTAEKVIQAFSATDSADKWAAAVAGLTPTTAGTGTRGVAGNDVSGVSEGDNLVFAIIDGSIAEGNNWYVLADYTIPAGSTFTPPTTGTKYKINVGTPTAGTFQLAGPTPTPVTPEPTSGLLLVLGMAGLALRRKMK